MGAAAIAPMMVTILTAAMIRKQRRIVEQLRSAGAIRPEHATSAATFGGEEGMALGNLERHGVVMKTGAGYYLDESAWDALRARRVRRGVQALVLMALGLAFLWAVLH